MTSAENRPQNRHFHVCIRSGHLWFRGRPAYVPLIPAQASPASRPSLPGTSAVCCDTATHPAASGTVCVLPRLGLHSGVVRNYVSRLVSASSLSVGMMARSAVSAVAALIALVATHGASRALPVLRVNYSVARVCCCCPRPRPRPRPPSCGQPPNTYVGCFWPTHSPVSPENSHPAMLLAPVRRQGPGRSYHRHCARHTWGSASVASCSAPRLAPETEDYPNTTTLVRRHPPALSRGLSMVRGQAPWPQRRMPATCTRSRTAFLWVR